MHMYIYTYIYTHINISIYIYRRPVFETSSGAAINMSQWARSSHYATPVSSSSGACHACVCHARTCDMCVQYLMCVSFTCVPCHEAQ